MLFLSSFFFLRSSLLFLLKAEEVVGQRRKVLSVGTRSEEENKN